MNIQTRYYALAALCLTMCFTACEDEDNENLMGNWVEADATFPGTPRGGAVDFKLNVNGQERVYVGMGANTSNTEDRERFTDFFYAYASTDNNANGTLTWSKANEVAPMAEYVTLQNGKQISARRNGAVAFALNGKGYIGTGYNGTTYLKDFWEYDPSGTTQITLADGTVKDAEGKWTRVADYPGDTCRYAVSFVLPDPKTGKEWAYVGTGEDYLSIRKSDFYRFDGEKWESAPNIGYPRCQATAFVANGIAPDNIRGENEPRVHKYAYVVGGVNSGAVWHFQRFNPYSEKWENLNHLADKTNYDFDDDYLNLAAYGCVSFVVGGPEAADGLSYEDPYLEQRCYITTGGPGYAGTLTWEYNPYYDYWLQKTSFEGTARKFATAFTLKFPSVENANKWGNDSRYASMDVPIVCLGTTSDITITASGGSFFTDTWYFRPYEPYEPKD